MLDANFASICGPGIAPKCAKCNSLKFAFVFKCFEDYSESEQSCGSREAKMTQKKFHLYFFGKWHVYKMMNNEKFE